MRAAAAAVTDSDRDSESATESAATESAATESDTVTESESVTDCGAESDSDRLAERQRNAPALTIAARRRSADAVLVQELVEVDAAQPGGPGRTRHVAAVGA